MIYLKLFERFKDIDDLCEEYGIYRYTVNSDGSIDVNGNVNLENENLDKLPLNFNYVSGYFVCTNNNLTSLIGSPKKIGGDFDCANNNLSSLSGAPCEVGGIFACNKNQLSSLKDSPKKVGSHFYCDNNQLITLKDGPKVVGGHFNFHRNPLPKLLYDNYKYIKEILKWQDEYNIWRNDKLDEFRFEEMMIDIKEEMILKMK